MILKLGICPQQTARPLDACLRNKDLNGCKRSHMGKMRYSILNEYDVNLFRPQEAFNNIGFPAAINSGKQGVFELIHGMLLLSTRADLFIQFAHPRGHAP